MLLELNIYPVECVATNMAFATTPELEYSSAGYDSKRSHDGERQAETLVTVG